MATTNNLLNTEKIPDYSTVLDSLSGAPSVVIENYTIGNVHITPNTLYTLPSRSNDITFIFDSGRTDRVNEYHFIITIAASATPTINWPSTFEYPITWNGGNGPAFDSEKTYEISIMNNIGVFIEL